RQVAKLEAFKASLFGFSHHLESRIAHPGRRASLMARAHEALEDGSAQAKLATDRLETFLLDRRQGLGVVGRVEQAVLRLRKKVGM
ncbi:MAG: hypothetical protein ACREFU_07160, partial [Acetobacteraceae bacterium]